MVCTPATMSSINQVGLPPEFHATRGKLQGDMADALEAVCNDPLPAYVDLTIHIAEDGVDAIRLMLEPLEESEEE
ncbi:hypothetical protein Hanom_Chr02g00138671 [Helianthus anomalus]